MRRIVWSADALDEFEAILAYVAGDDPVAAERVAKRIERTIAALAEMPIGRRGRVAGTYEKVLSSLPYIIAYALERDCGGGETEPSRVCRRLQLLRGWSDGQARDPDEVFA